MHKWLSISAVVTVLDLYTKHLIQRAFAFGEQLPLTSFFDLVHYHNEGSAFGFLNDAGGWQKWFFTAISVVAIVVITYLIRKHSNEKLFCLGLALVLGGAVEMCIRDRFKCSGQFRRAPDNCRRSKIIVRSACD